MNYDAIILGGGAAGLMAAATAGQLGARVLLLEGAEKIGKKILISGGGRCNFTNTGTEPENFLSENPHFVKSALSRYNQWDFLALVEKNGIAWHEKTLGQLFCDGSARQIVAILAAECDAGGVEFRTNAQLTDIHHENGAFSVCGATAPNLIVATGGPSIPKMGATGIAYDIAHQFGLNVVSPRPALVPFTLGEKDKDFKSISGVAVPSVARSETISFEEASLFTHRGLSGPAILQVSSYWQPGERIWINILPDAHRLLLQAKQEMPRAHIKAALDAHLPRRLVEILDQKHELRQQLANIPDAKLNAFADWLTNMEFHPSGTEGYAKAEVTAGGIDTAELSSKTMESKKIPGLFFIGECVDVTGWLGGYNFQWAWSSGVAAGREIGARSAK